MSIQEKLMRIQTEIKAPKNLLNKFGGYRYRNAEGICEAVKPYLQKEKCALVLKDEIIAVGDRIYVKAIATLLDCETDETFEATAYARESLAKKGMDDSQITGTASSYARKYALNGLLLLDDTKDEDSEECKTYKEEKAKAEEDAKKTEEIGNMKISEVKQNILRQKCAEESVDLEKLLKIYEITEVAKITEKIFRDMRDNWTANKLKIKEM
jgi:hypothetical protein